MGKKTRDMSVLNALIKNPLDGEQRPWKPWYGYLFLFILVVCAGLYVHQRMNGGPLIPTLSDPATVYENAKAARERQQEVAMDEAQDARTDVALSDVAKAALAILENARIVLPDVESFSGDAVELATWIEQADVTVNATVIEDPSTDEITAYLAQGIVVVVPVVFPEDVAEHWVVLDETSADAVMSAMVGNRVVIIERI